MPLKLVPPRAGKTPYWTVRGTYLGVYVERSTKTTERVKAQRSLAIWREEIERGRYAKPGEPTFLDAAVAYMAATGNERFLEPLLEKLGALPLRGVAQGEIDQAAIALYPNASPATRNRQVHTPVSAILKHAGREAKLRRPSGARGTQRTEWMTPQQAFRLIDAAKAIDHEFGLFLSLLLYTGMRLSEALSLTCARVDLLTESAFVSSTKNGTPRSVYLPPAAVAALATLPRGIERAAERVFRFRKNGRLYALMMAAKKAGGADLAFVTFHVFRHTWATWMRRYGGLDTTGLVATGAWKDRTSAARYEHTTISEEARKAIRLPVENPGKRSRKKAK